MIRRNFLFGLIAACVPFAGSFAAEPDVIKARFNDYWSAYLRADYAKAADFIHPEDLQGLQTKVLPLFVRAQQTTVPDIKQVVDFFFDGVPQAKRATLTGNETFQQLNKFIAAASPDTMELISKARIEVGTVNVDPSQPSNATVEYKMAIGDGAQSDTQRLTKSNGQWYLRTTETPAEVAAKFKTVLEP